MGPRRALPGCARRSALLQREIAQSGGGAGRGGVLTVPPAIAIVGWEEGSAGQIHSWLEAATGQRVATFVHPSDALPELRAADVLRGREGVRFDFPVAGAFKGVPLICAADWPVRLAAAGIAHALVTLADPRERHAAIDAARAAGLALINAIHPSATIMPDATLGQNVIVHARAFVGYRADVNDGVILNTGAQIDHHCVLHPCCTLDPAVVCAGGVIVEAYAHVNPGAVIAKRTRIGSGAVVAAGAVVVRDVAPGTRVMGVPAKPG